MAERYQVRSRLWYLFPIFFPLIGGVTTYFILRDDDPKKAKNCLWLGIILAIVSVSAWSMFGRPFLDSNINAWSGFALTSISSINTFSAPIDLR